MVSKLKTLLDRHTVIRYVLVGGLSYCIELSVLLCLYKLAGLSAELSTAIAFWVGLSASFILQKLIAFRDYERTARLLSKQLVSYGALVAVNYVFTLGLVALFPSHLVVFSRTLALIITTFWNYLIYKRIFNASDKSKTRSKNGWRLSRRDITFLCLASAPVVIFFYQYLASGNKLLVGDFDYSAQMYEAFRISVLHYHQLPLWNPWMSGGVPLFANPQFGLFSIQSVFVLIFGTIIGLKLAYITYALSGFWGMYRLTIDVIKTDKIRALLVSYVWIFCGFFAGHNISHYTFTSFFLLPWLIYFLARRDRPKSWLWFGVVESIIILSSMHYAFLMLAVAIAIFFILSLFKLKRTGGFPLRVQISRADWVFTYRATLIILILSSYRLLTTYYFVSHNEKSAILVNEPSTSMGILIKAIFLPIGTFLAFPHTRYGWGEYSMYLGLGLTMALIIIVFSLIYSVIRMRKIGLNVHYIVPILIIGLVGFMLALGDFGKFSPYNILHHFPGFSQTRVSARWQILTIFALLVFLASWPKQKRAINILLLVAVIELFFSYGPPRINGNQESSLPPAAFSNTFREYDNSYKHLDAATNPMHSYFYTTEQNIGQIYSDDSIVDTLDKVLGTSKCGYNKNPACDLVLSHNAKVIYWSPNKIVLKRTASGPIELNMNVEQGWRVNGLYPFASLKSLNPQNQFVLSGINANYELTYAPKFSPSWLKWRLSKV